ncbi:1990_t:CDS:2 [Paraglomus brasilianum]|uniref:1990_t:CDS:1 n=1 Tax=Paraglomus brasilianum TaxID=144538 RepID=A0A9N9GBQ1_9GLOM|nr:1990_t:CDS:2 [Paraglomus brasilianum]
MSTSSLISLNPEILGTLKTLSLKFGNAFKQAIAEELEKGELDRERAERICPRYSAGDPANGLDAILRKDYIYAGGTGEINDLGNLLPNDGNPLGVALKNAGGAGNVQLPNDIDVTINHGGTSERINLTGGLVED